MKNKYGIKITKAERKYFNSLKQSIRRSTVSIKEVLSQYEKQSYLRAKPHNYAPTIKKTTVHTFKSREDFLKEVESLSKLKTELAINKPRKPKYLDELPKRLQKDFEREERNYGRTVKLRPPRSMKTKQQRLLSTKFINKRNTTYRENMITAIFNTFEEKLARELINALRSMSELEFLKFFLSRPDETISFVYLNPIEPDKKQLDLMKSILNAKKS